MDVCRKGAPKIRVVLLNSPLKPSQKRGNHLNNGTPNHHLRPKSRFRAKGLVGLVRLLALVGLLVLRVLVLEALVVLVVLGLRALQVLLPLLSSEDLKTPWPRGFPCKTNQRVPPPVTVANGAPALLAWVRALEVGTSLEDMKGKPNPFKPKTESHFGGALQNTPT